MTPKAVVLMVFGMALAATAAAQQVDTHQHRFGDADKWSQVFDDPKRDATQKPHEVIKALALAPDALVADIGSGTGYFAVRLAHAVPKGRVYGVDVEPAMVKHLAERAKREKIVNLTSLAGTPGDARLPEKVDLALIVDVYHHIDQREGYLRRLAGSLKRGGRVAVIDFRPDARSGPPKGERIAAERVKAEFKSAGFAVAQEHDFLPEQYFIVFRRAKE